jgi:hypothetical protein
LHLGDSFRVSSQRGQKAETIKVMHARRAGIELQGAAVFGFRSLPVIIFYKGVGECSVSLGQRTVECKSFHGCSLGFGQRFLRCQDTILAGSTVELGQACVGWSVARVLGD